MTKRMEDIGFYTLCDARCDGLSPTSPMWRCEMILTDRCNFSCPYCRGHGHGDMALEDAILTLQTWIDEGLKNVRFSGGEPLLYPHLNTLVELAAKHCERVAISSNGSLPTARYRELFHLGVNDFSISLDSCCASFGDRLAGISGAWERVVNNIKVLSELTYVTAGVVVTDETADTFAETVKFAHSLGVADIRVIPAAQESDYIEGAEGIPQYILDDCPILAYRIRNLIAGRNVRGILPEDCHRCALAVDDSVVAGNKHFPCVIHMREGGKPIGNVGANMRAERIAWFKDTNTYNEPICRKNCLDICIDHNNRCPRLEN